MESASVRPWYRKKRYLIPLGVVALVSLGSVGAGSSSPQAQQSSTQPAAAAAALDLLTASQTPPVNPVTPVSGSPASQQPPTPTPAQVSAPAQTQPTNQPESSGLSNDSYYKNVDGNQVHSPAYSNTVPAGASAQCGDGTYSFSQNRRGTCSHHGGVAEWL